MLIGTYQHNIDSKGRIIIPSKFREELGEVFYATKGKDDTIMVMSKEQWNKLGEKIASKPSADTVALKRFFFAGAAELVPDKQGRVLIPQILRDHAKIEKDVVITGSGEHAEIWDLQRWIDYNASLTDSEVYAIMGDLQL